MQDFPSGLLSYLFKISYDNLSKYDEKKNVSQCILIIIKPINIYSNMKLTYFHQHLMT